MKMSSYNNIQLTRVVVLAPIAEVVVVIVVAVDDVSGGVVH